MSTSIQAGDGVYYHGSATDYHGPYTVAGTGERYILVSGTGESATVLHNVRRESFEFMVRFEMEQS